MLLIIKTNTATQKKIKNTLLIEESLHEEHIYVKYV